MNACAVSDHPALSLREPLAAGLAVEGTGTLEFLLRRMRLRSDFPARSMAITAINRMAGSDKSDAGMLAAAILKDFALTNKILRLVNSVQYSAYASTRISTISRAIVILGVDTIRNMTVSLMLFDQLSDRTKAAALGNEFLRASLGALLARELCAATLGGNAEEAYICALFHHLGRLLTQCYLSEEAAAIQQLIQHEQIDEEAAAARVLGLSWQELGIGVARSWAFPESMIHSMRRLPPGRVPASRNAQDGLRALSGFSSELGGLIETSTRPDLNNAIEQLRLRYRDSFRPSLQQVMAAIDTATAALAELAEIFGLNPRTSAVGQHLKLAAIEGRPIEAQDAPSRDSESLLAVGIQDISNALVEDCALSDLLRIVVETIYRALDVQRVILCLRDGRTQRMQARLVLGADPAQTCARFHFALGGENDLFNAILSHEVDVLIADAAEPKLHGRLPDWYRQHFNAASFLVLPLRLRQAPIAMIYADHPYAGGLRISTQEFALLRTLRNQAILAIKQQA